MKSKAKFLLAADAVINLILGLILFFFPAGIMEFLGLPQTDTYFYTSILGGVIFGIGAALLLEWHWGDAGLRGLGLAGAIAINLCGGSTLLYWILFSNLDIPLRGMITLCILAILVIGIGLLEWISKSWVVE